MMGKSVVAAMLMAVATLCLSGCGTVLNCTNAGEPVGGNSGFTVESCWIQELSAQPRINPYRSSPIGLMCGGETRRHCWEYPQPLICHYPRSRTHSRYLSRFS